MEQTAMQWLGPWLHVEIDVQIFTNFGILLSWCHFIMESEECHGNTLFKTMWVLLKYILKD